MWDEGSSNSCLPVRAAWWCWGSVGLSGHRFWL